MNICIAATTKQKEWRKWQRRRNWRFDSTGCCAPIPGIQGSFVSRAARGCRWSAQARPRDLAPMQVGVRIEESWSLLRPYRWLAEPSVRRNRRKLIHRESFRASVLHLSEIRAGAASMAIQTCLWTTPSFLSSSGRRGGRSRSDGAAGPDRTTRVYRFSLPVAA